MPKSSEKREYITGLMTLILRLRNSVPRGHFRRVGEREMSEELTSDARVSRVR